MLWAGDNPDTFRIKIWNDISTIFDNGIAQPLDGGSIVIHDSSNAQPAQQIASRPGGLGDRRHDDVAGRVARLKRGLC